ncbi:MAG: oxidoreductase [Bacteroidetes bacterium B1(2017)]|nr:MAG: oxidoreductase [Bacteroidetes bacterium B1(2017)]
MQRTAIVIGATGLIGRNLVFELLKSEKYTKVTVFARRDLVIKHDKLVQILLDFDHLEDYSNDMYADDVFCCLGSTKAKTPDIITYRKIDFDYPLAVAKLAKQNGADRYFLISSMGANKNSTIFYSKLKGEIEEAIAKIGFTSFHVFRPSLLLGSRAESRPMETISQYLMRVLNPLFIGPLRLYKAVEGVKVAKAMMIVATKNLTGYHLWLNNQILDLVEGGNK